MQTTTRNATLADLAALLKTQHAAKIDVVAPATLLRARDGIIHVKGAEQQITDSGVTTVDGAYRPTDVFDQHLATKLDIPGRYVKRMRSERPDIFDLTVNAWLHGRTRFRGNVAEVVYPADPRSFMFRGFRGEDGEVGVARALLSDRYSIVDNLDCLTAVLSGIKDSGVPIEILSCDLTDAKMYLKISAPSVAALAPELLKGYRSPFSGASGDENPTIFAGFIVSNSEVGGGAFSITPSLTVQVCTNGLTMTKEAMRAIHLGGKLEEGVIRWSADTQRKSLEIITAKARDAVATFLDVDYVRSAISKLEEKAGVPVSNPAETVKAVTKKLLFTEEQTEGILNMFIQGGQTTAGGLLQAVTAYSQTIDDADMAYDVEARGVDAMELAAAR